MDTGHILIGADAGQGLCQPHQSAPRSVQSTRRPCQPLRLPGPSVKPWSMNVLR